jgi:hypothetical protein
MRVQILGTGEMMGTDAAKSAQQAAEAIRAINHATIRTVGYGPNDVYDIVAELGVLTERLPQAFGQLARILEQLNNNGHVEFDPGSPFAGHPADGVTELQAVFRRASESADELRYALADGQRILSAAHPVDPLATMR